MTVKGNKRCNEKMTHLTFDNTFDPIPVRACTARYVQFKQDPSMHFFIGPNVGVNDALKVLISQRMRCNVTGVIFDLRTDARAPYVFLNTSGKLEAVIYLLTLS